MARLWGAATELAPLIRAAAVFLALLLGGALPVRAQSADPPDTSSAAKRAAAAAEIATTRLAGQWIPQGGGSITFRLSERFEVGGSARVALATPSVERGGSALRLHFGYAGLSVRARPAPIRWPGFRLGLLMGGGNADVTDAAMGSLLDSDNGFVVEPSASYTRALGSSVATTAAAAWRVPTRFALIGPVRSRDLRGPSLAIGLSIGPF